MSAIPRRAPVRIPRRAGVVLDELNLKLKEYDLFFGPETSTSNRCNIGGMVGNNACGSHSIIYGSTREHTIELKTLLSDGSEATFGPLDKDGFNCKCDLDNLEGEKEGKKKSRLDSLREEVRKKRKKMNRMDSFDFDTL